MNLNKRRIETGIFLFCLTLLHTFLSISVVHADSDFKCDGQFLMNRDGEMVLNFEYGGDQNCLKAVSTARGGFVCNNGGFMYSVKDKLILYWMDSKNPDQDKYSCLIALSTAKNGRVCNNGSFMFDTSGRIVEMFQSKEECIKAL